jgi:rhodanese-related sulfurtransferase
MPRLASPWAKQLLRRLLSVEIAETRSERYIRLISSARSGISEIAPPAAAQAAAQGGIIIDVRERREFERGHPIGAINIPRGRLELEIESYVPQENQPLLCLCDDGSRSVLAAETLIRMGFSSVYSIEGGFRAWVEAGLPARTNRHLMEE